MDATLDSTQQLSPMMIQWKDLKNQVPNALLLFRLGDFYEAFFEDAKLLSEAIDVVLTQRQSIPMSGIPYHQLENYLERLIEKHYIVAIAEQVESPDEKKTLVRREITEIISPATFLNSKAQQAPTYFASIYQINATFGLAFLELSTGDFVSLEVGSLSSLIDELTKRRPVELLISSPFKNKQTEVLDQLSHLFSYRMTIAHESRFEPGQSIQTVLQFFQVHSLASLSLEPHPAASVAIGALIKYLTVDLKRNLSHIKKVRYESTQHFVQIDHATLFHLDILKSLTQNKRPSLEGLLDRTLTPMGSRTLQFFLTHPLIDIELIKKRQEAVSALIQKNRHQPIRAHLDSIKDLQRLNKRIFLELAQPKELTALVNGLKKIVELDSLIENFQITALFPKIGQIKNLHPLILKLDQALRNDLNGKIGQGPIFQIGFDSNLDELYQFKIEGETFLENYQAELKEELGIKNLKVGYNRAFGYFIEVSRGQSHLMPESFNRLQTLVNTERFISQKLKDYEMKMLTCESQIADLEVSLYRTLIEEIKTFHTCLESLSIELGFLDVIAAFADLATENNYIKPVFDLSNDLFIEEGFHPVLAFYDRSQQMIPNDTDLRSPIKMGIITGPNMAGKSTYIRQTALLVLLAQIGSFVPAKSMRLGVVDKIFSRIGASDDLSRGLSTFMVEMIETANILNQATERSLIILDEIGRGTSTYDGIAIASAVAEYLASKKSHCPKTLFATHYFELTKLEEQFQEIKNLHIAIEESGDEIRFLRKIRPGLLDKSFGIHVAKLAGIPHPVIHRAKQLLKQFEQSRYKKESSQAQLSLFDLTHDRHDPIIKQIKEIEVDNLSPKEALEFVYTLKNLVHDAL